MYLKKDIKMLTFISDNRHSYGERYSTVLDSTNLVDNMANAIDQRNIITFIF